MNMDSLKQETSKTVLHGHLNTWTYVINQKKEIVILKVDIEKAFDKVEYSAIIYTLRHFGFGEKFIQWIMNILNSSTTSIILNGVPGKVIKCKRGVRHGDPLS